MVAATAVAIRRPTRQGAALPDGAGVRTVRCAFETVVIIELLQVASPPVAAVEESQQPGVV